MAVELKATDGLLDLDALAASSFPPIRIRVLGSEYSTGSITEEDLAALSQTGGESDTKLSTLIERILDAPEGTFSGCDFRILALVARAIMEQFQHDLDEVGMGNSAAGTGVGAPSL